MVSSERMDFYDQLRERVQSVVDRIRAARARVNRELAELDSERHQLQELCDHPGDPVVSSVIEYPIAYCAVCGKEWN